MAQKVALVTGVTGQDGSYLVELLLSKNYIVHGALLAPLDCHLLLLNLLQTLQHAFPCLLASRGEAQGKQLQPPTLGAHLTNWQVAPAYHLHLELPALRTRSR